MTGLFSEGIGYSGINTAKSAISSLAGVVLNKDIGSHVLIKWFMKGIFNKKHHFHNFTSTWNVTLVLNRLSTVDIQLYIFFKVSCLAGIENWAKNAVFVFN